MISIEKEVETLIKLVSNYQSEEALKQFYHENFVAYENMVEVRFGLNLSLVRMQEEKNSMRKLYYLKALRYMCKENESMIHWVCELTDLEGKHWIAEEVNIATWQNGKIIEEKYIYHMPKEISKPSIDEFIWKPET
tara:strand:- start:78675 stop:79082 length:408 start_codon:yes stop_codon:yes gene_type:complete